jgi:hypothetical protein
MQRPPPNDAFNRTRPVRAFYFAIISGAAPVNLVLLGLTVKRLLVICWLLLATTAEAGQEWELISVTRGPTWEVNEAKGALKQNRKVLEGILRDKTDGKADYQIRIELNGGHAQATFRFISENDEGTTLTGIYKKTAKPTKTHCPEQIQLMNSFRYIGLARDACEP